MKNRYPSVTTVADKSLQSLTTPGIKITGSRSIDIKSEFIISGKFVVAEEEFKRLGSSPHRDLVLTVLRAPMYGSYHPMKNCMLFRDDVENSSGVYSGWFNLDIWAYSGFRTEGTYHVRISLGEALSNVIETSVSSNPKGHQFS